MEGGVPMRYQVFSDMDGVLVDLGSEMGLIANINAKYVCAEAAGDDPLIANRDSVGAWETFRWELK